ncbi:hypothetical protein LshimejAT787_0200800 [Lyophyllum shimeji]|uniref:Uncharacterized protein n=1 Tax=Lyophyllum shimeji TaxID=47721 RepID=A0A9P3PEL6_LYOSH|nr:hypothetical protein LshimejAT787_0200800 [Lyophyllum shimeji]
MPIPQHTFEADSEKLCFRNTECNCARGYNIDFFLHTTLRIYPAAQIRAHAGETRAYAWILLDTVPSRQPSAFCDLPHHSLLGHSHLDGARSLDKRLQDSALPPALGGPPPFSAPTYLALVNPGELTKAASLCLRMISAQFNTSDGPAMLGHLRSDQSSLCRIC